MLRHHPTDDRYLRTLPELPSPWRRAAAARERNAWIEVTQGEADELLGTVPPIYFPGGFAVGEPIRHDYRGRAVYLCIIQEPGAIDPDRPVGAPELPRYYARESTIPPDPTGARESLQ